MYRHNGRPARKQDRSTLYGVFIILALLPTAFSVAFEYSARGITSGRPWLVSVFPLLLLVAARFLPTVWHRSSLAVFCVGGIAIASGAGFVWHLGGLLGFLGVSTAMRWVAPGVITLLYTGFGALMGSIRDRATRRRPHPGQDAEYRQPARQPVTRSSRRG